MKTLQLGKLFGLQISVLLTNFLIGTFVLWIALTSVAYFGIKLPLTQSILLGLSAALLHWLWELIHCLGHSIAAKQTGYPMTGIVFGAYYLFARTDYPKDEPELLPFTHIRRALGGPIINGILSITLYFLLPIWQGDWYWLGLYVLLENIFMYTLQVFLPFGFNDGSTILNNLKKMKK